MIDVPPAYFAEMIARGRSGELRLDAALFAILRRGGRTTRAGRDALH